MQYPLSCNIDFAIAALAFCTAIYITCRNKYGVISRANKCYYRILMSVIIACISDVILNVGKTYPQVWNGHFVVLGRMAYSVSLSVMLVFICQYVTAYTEQVEGKTNLDIVWADYATYIIAGLFAIASIIDPFTKWITYVNDAGEYVSGPLYYIVFIVPCLSTVIDAIVVIRYKKCYSRFQFIAVLAMGSFCVFFILLEMFLSSKYVLSMFGVSLACLLLQMSLETPDTSKLYETIDELEKSEKEAEAAKIEAEKANRAKSDFLARMSHEIRTPMNAIMGMNEIIINETTEENVKEHAEDAYKSSTALLGIINDILDFSKIESDRMEIVPGNYRLSDFVKILRTMFETKAHDKNLSITFDIDGTLPNGLYADDMKIRQVMVNLISNSIKYTDRGNVTVSIKRIGDADHDDMVDILYNVKDTGRGIRESDLPKLFDVFERIDAKANRNIEGTGLGMSIVSRLLLLMDSKIEVKSEFGKGSEFSFVLRQVVTDHTPVSAAESVNISQDKHSVDVIKAPNAKVLVVDDNPVNLRVFTTLLKKTEIKFTPVLSGTEAINVCSHNKFDLIFMDHFMPELDGVEAMKQIRAQEGPNSETPIIVLTANAVKGTEEEYRNLGFDDVAYKPATLAGLNEVLNRYLG